MAPILLGLQALLEILVPLPFPQSTQSLSAFSGGANLIAAE
jgi:hypothetical protein